MLQITSITSDAKQKMQIPLDNGEMLDFYLYYMPTQYSWYYDFSYKNYTNKGNKVVLSPNSIRHLRYILPFGISFMAEGGLEPFAIDDFESGRVEMDILNQNEVYEVENLIYAN